MASTTTLGDVLYAKPKQVTHEREWVALVEAVAMGDQLALHSLYDMAHRLVFTLCVRITANRETAEELTVDVFHDIWRNAARFDAEAGTVLAWIMNQTRSRAIDRLRFNNRQKRAPRDDPSASEEAVPDPRDVAVLRSEGARLRQALTKLAPSELEAIEATFFAGQTYAEAAERLGQPLGTIKTRIRSALHKLRHEMCAPAGEP